MKQGQRITVLYGHGDQAFERYTYSSGNLSDLLRRQNQLSCKQVGLRFHPSLFVSVAPVKAMQIGKRALDPPIRLELMRFDKEVAKLMRDRKATSAP